MNATEILNYLQERQLVSACVKWCAQDPDCYGISRNTLFRAAKRERQKEPFTTRQRFLLNKMRAYIDKTEKEKAQPGMVAAQK